MVRIADRDATISVSRPITVSYPKGFEPPDYVSRPEATHEFKASASWSWGDTTKKAFFHSYRNGNWKALSMIVRENDELTFTVGNGGNDYLAACLVSSDRLNRKSNGEYHHPDYDAIYCDTLNVTVTRKGKTLVSSLLLDYSLCPDNTARPVGR
jgi:hypothetical protein